MALMTQNLAESSWTLQNGNLSLKAQASPALALSNLSGSVLLNEKEISLSGAKAASDFTKDSQAAAHEEFILENGVRWIRKVYQDGRSVILRNWLRNDTNEVVKLGNWTVISGTAESGFRAETGIAPEKARLFGWLPWDMYVADLAQENKEYLATTLFHLSDTDSHLTLMLGFITLDRMSVMLKMFTGAKGEGLTGLKMWCEPGEFKLYPGKSIESEALRAAYYKDQYEALTSWADEMYDVYKPDFTGTAGTVFGFGSWRDVFTSKTSTVESLMRRGTATFDKVFKGFDHHFIYGSPHAIYKGGLPGHWMVFEDADSGNYGDVYKALHEKYGYVYKFWFSPFWFFEEAEETFAENQENLLRWPDGKMVRYPFYGGWELGRGKYGKDELHTVFLDGTHPRTKDYLQKVFRFYRSIGVRGVMLDFLSVIPGAKYYDETKLPIEASRSIFAAIREAAGRDFHLQTAVSSSPSFIGCVNSARVVRDFGESRPQYPLPNWQNSSYCMHDYHFANIDSFMQNVAANWFTNGKIFINDLNDLLIDTPVPLNFAQSAITIFGLNGDSPVACGDDYTQMDPDRLRMFKKILPRTKGVTTPVDLFDRTTAQGGCHILKKAIHTKWDDYMMCAVFNTQPDAAPYQTRIEFERLGLDPQKEYCVYEFWNTEYVGIFKGSFPTEVTQNSCKLYRISEHREYPWLIGTDMTIEQGNAEVEDLVWDEKALTLTAKVTRPAGEFGRLFFLMPLELRVVNHDVVNTMRETIDQQTVAGANVEFKSDHETVVVQFARMDTDKIARGGWLEYTTKAEWLKFRAEHPYKDPARVLR